MTIERYSFRPPVNVDEAGLADIDRLMFFAQKTIIPPDHKIDITPPDYIDKYSLITKARSGEIEDTVGELQRSKGNRQKSEQPVQGFLNRSYTAEGPDKVTHKIDENTPIALIAKPNISSDKRRITSLNLGEAVIYTPAGKLVDEQKAKEALYMEFQRILHATMPAER